MSTLDQILTDARRRMSQAVSSVAEQFGAIRTGRANPKILERISVDYYGNPTPLRELANFSVPEPRMLLVNPYDPSSADDIEKAIRDADLGLNPANDGGTIRCVFPELTEERRREYVKQAKEIAEDGKIGIRNIRRDARDGLQQLAEEGEVGEDEERRYEKELEEVTSKHVAKIDSLLEDKQEDLMEV